nr:RlpA-like double-psi beta-barrel domain-containing protein [Acetobacter garciniae]
MAACSHGQRARPDPHYVVGAPWQADGRWFYPREEFSWQGTGVAVRQTGKDGELTADGEVRDSTTMTGSHQSLQLPSVVRVINLENGREVTIRLNDRGPAEAGRMIALSARAADLLAMGRGPAQVRVVEDEAASRQLAETLPGGPMLQISAAPLERVTQTDLGGAQGVSVVGTDSGPPPADGAPRAAPVLPDLPAVVRQGQPGPGTFWVETMDFTSRYAAMVQAARQGGVLRPAMVGQGMLWAVRFGPFVTIQEADAALKRALATGLTGSHLVVE